MKGCVVIGRFNEGSLDHHDIFKQMVERLTESIIIHIDGEIVYINQSGAELLGGTTQDFIGKELLSFIQEDYHQTVQDHIHQIVVNDASVSTSEQVIKRKDGSTVEVEVNCNPLQMENQRAVQSVIRDITERKKTEKSLDNALKEINALASPVVPILNGIAVLPLIGSIETERAQQFLDHIPATVAEQNIEWLILDFSGIINLDTYVADYLFKINETIRLLGIETIITGMRPDLAQVATQLGIKFSIKSFGSVRQALNFIGVRG
ncbi:PAS domain S-box protein [Sediminibacillus halophilus]|uniref:PAS domain S-box-containing protein n=1 Tax=Sediminibacillus halophilus TaxID=482461 RepID=A0A1G9NY74_9BACI|nr:PAS domain S-box protein [Sediminibacillus halophilus]SDL91321.1 PAS domain S-box-containing protein [Sediminibacillus halophilus]